MLRGHGQWLGRGRKGRGQAVFKDVALRHVTIKHTNLFGVEMARVDMSDVTLRDTGMEGVAMTDVTFEGIPLPVVPNIDKVILDLIEKNLAHLDMNTWHSKCGTAHCRAGFAVKLAGKAGTYLELQVGTYLAGCFVYGGSRPGIPIPDFFESTKEALASIKEDAEKYSK